MKPTNTRMLNEVTEWEKELEIASTRDVVKHEVKKRSKRDIIKRNAHGSDAYTKPEQEKPVSPLTFPNQMN